MDIRLLGIEKDFDGAAALRGVSLDVRPGELLALLGPSGSGKTTLLRVIAGLEIPSAGRVLFGGEDATHIPVQRRQVGFVFQHYALFRHMRVAENVAYGLRARPRTTRPPEAEIARRVADLLSLVQLEGYERRFPAQLSGGQRQRVALARALAVEPRVLLLDEPFGALDACVRKDLRRWLRDIHERTGQTTVFVTHDQDEAMELADRIAVLNGGLIEQVGTPDEVQGAPATPFVTTFLGDALKLDASVENGCVVIGGRVTRIPPPAGALGPVAAYCRPWDIRLAPPETADVTGRVRGVRQVRGMRLVAVDLSPESRVEVEASDSMRLAPGEPVGLHLERVQFYADPAEV